MLRGIAPVVACSKRFLTLASFLDTWPRIEKNSPPAVSWIASKLIELVDMVVSPLW